MCGSGGGGGDSGGGIVVIWFFNVSGENAMCERTLIVVGDMPKHAEYVLQCSMFTLQTLYAL